MSRSLRWQFSTVAPNICGSCFISPKNFGKFLCPWINQSCFYSVFLCTILFLFYLLGLFCFPIIFFPTRASWNSHGLCFLSFSWILMLYVFLFFSFLLDNITLCIHVYCSSPQCNQWAGYCKKWSTRDNTLHLWMERCLCCILLFPHLHCDACHHSRVCSWCKLVKTY